jgi:hypothetical protein
MNGLQGLNRPADGTVDSVPCTARNGDWDVTMSPKSTVTLVLKKAGLIDYYCRFIRT